MSGGAGVYRGDIDGVRGVAVAAVVLGHAGVPGFGGGHVGVDVFFVISGFLITGILVGEGRGGGVSLARFYGRRLRRLAPALLVMLAVTTAVAWAVLLPDELRAFGYNLRGAVGFAANLTHWDSTGYFDPRAGDHPLLHMWSLAVEEQFYLLYPLAVMWLPQAGLRRAVGWAVAVSLALAVAHTAWDPQGAFYLPHTRVWELGVGALVALAPRRGGAGAAGLGLGLIGWAVWGTGWPFPGLGALPPVAGAALVLGARPSAVGRALAVAPLRGLGVVSYSLYLWHWPVLVLWGLAQGAPLSPGQTAVAVVGSLGLAVLSWAWVERPVRVGPRRPALPVLVRGAGVAAAGLVAISLIGDWTDGAPGRYGGAAALALAARAEWAAAPGRACLRAGEPGHPACRFGAPGVVPDIVLWGDSHAAALQPALDAAARAGARAGVAHTRPACWPVPGAALPGARGGACAAHNAAVRAGLLAGPPRDVVLMASWAVGPAAAAAPLAALVAELAARGHRVTLVAGLPLPGLDLAAATARRAVWGRPPPPPPGPADLARLARAEAGMLGAIAPGDLAHRVVLADAYCGAGGCALTPGGAPVFADAEHLSPGGARAAAPLFAPVLARP